ncbi:hypothetical protein BV25DRAFT_1922585 [Artomyces pyxidatus]|uniref:Uncharacterized protein n=1 Tax=Artomyces pyxidatus TaxID=48021 RepID=A0ACB8SDZ5_9AGAM|nr:hypothetical protein BV25DRAFT_1922585 [Artomyces pyxidatus]
MSLVLATSLSESPMVPSMSVTFWGADGGLVRGKVQSTSLQSDGTLVVVIRLEGEVGTVSFP